MAPGCTIRPGTPGWSSGDPGERHSAGKIFGIDLGAAVGEEPLRPVFGDRDCSDPVGGLSAPGGGSAIPQPSRIYLGYEIQDSESNILTPS